MIDHEFNWWGVDRLSTTAKCHNHLTNYICAKVWTCRPLRSGYLKYQGSSKLLSFAKLTSNRSNMALNGRLKRRLSCMSQKAHVSNVSQLRHINSLLQWILVKCFFLFGFSTDFRKIIWLIWFFGFRFSWARRPLDCYPPTMLNQYYSRL